MFGRTKTPQNPLWELRDKLLNNPPQEAASLVVPGTSVWGVLMETGYPQGPVTLIALGDGTTSLYFPTGGGVIGAGAHVAVRAASTALLTTADAMKSSMSPPKGFDFPSQGRVRFFVLTLGGVIAAEDDEQSLGHGSGPLSAVFHAGQAVISQARIVSQRGEDA